MQGQYKMLIVIMLREKIIKKKSEYRMLKDKMLKEQCLEEKTKEKTRVNPLEANWSPYDLDQSRRG